MVLSELEARRELGRPIAGARRLFAHLRGDVDRWILLRGDPEGRGPAELHVEAEVRVAERVRERRELGQSLQPVPAPAEHVESLIAGLEETEPVLGRGRDRQGQIDHPEHLLGCMHRERVPRRLRGEPHAHRDVARGASVQGQQRKALGNGFSRHEQLHHCGVHLPSPCSRERGRRELADVLVGEAEVGGGCLRMLEQQPRRDRRLEFLLQGGDVTLLVAERQLDLPEILETEMPSEDGRLGERGLRLLRESPGPPRDQRLHGLRDESLRLAAERPHAVDLLDHPGLAIRPRELLEDERNPLRLAVDRRRARRVDPAAEHLLQQLGALDLREPVRPQSPNHPEALHVRDEVHRFRDEREFLGPDRGHQEDWARRVGAHDVAEEPQAVVVRPLQVVEQQGDRSFRGEGTHGHGAEVERPQQLLVGREAGQGPVLVALEGVRTSLQGLGGCGLRRRLPGGRRGHDRTREQEWTADLLVGRHHDRGEPPLDGDLLGGEQKPSLADPRFALDGERGESPALRHRQLLADRGLLRLPTDDRAGGAPHVQGKRRQRLEDSPQRLCLVDHLRHVRSPRMCPERNDVTG